MQKPTREQIFDYAAKQLRQDFEELKVVPHAGEKGGEAEALVRKFLIDHLPKRFGVGAGFILDGLDNVSQQTDVIVYDAYNCPTYRVSETAAIFPANNVCAAIEVKSKIDGRGVLDGLNKISSIKSLAKKRSTGGGAVLDQTFGAILAFESSITLEKISEVFHHWIGKHRLGTHTDIICVLDRGFVTLMVQLPGRTDWTNIILEGLPKNSEGMHISIGIHEVLSKSLDAFFRILLAQLSLFRSMVDHPGFNWNQSLPNNGKAQVSYLTSITHEQDPAKAEQKLQEYAAQIQSQFAKNSKS